MSTPNKKNNQGQTPGPANPSAAFEELNQRALPYLQEVLEDLLELEEVQQQGAEFLMLNPLRHDDEVGSFKINVGTGQWSDFAVSPLEGASGGDVTSLVAYSKKVGQGPAASLLRKFLDGLDAHDAPAPIKATARAARATPTQQEDGPEMASPAKPKEVIPPLKTKLAGYGQPAVTYSYLDAAALPVLTVCRYEALGKNKEFRPHTLTRDQATDRLAWQVNTPKKLLPLFNRDQIAAKPDALIVFCEGEKAALAAAELRPSAVATTTAFGSKSPAKSDFRSLTGRGVIVAPDNDVSGEEYKESVIQLATAAGAEIVGVLHYPKHLFGQVIDGVRQDVAKGYDLADALAEGWTEERFNAVLGEIITTTQAPPEAQPISTALQLVPAAVQASEGARVEPMPAQIADGFTVTSDAVYWEKPVKDGATQAVRLASRIEVAALTRSVESQSWGRLVRFFDPDGVSHDWCIPQSMFGADLGSIWSTLLSLGCDITAEPNLRIQLARYLAGCQPAVRGLSVKRPGWTGNAFVFPDGSSYGDDGQLISFETRDPINQAMFTASGDATAWNEHIGRLCVGNTRLALAVCIALSGPTLHLLGAESSGFHFRGRSSIGKTTILRVACSVWGSPEKVKRNWRATSNGLEVVAAQHNDLLLALDEFGEITPAEASAVTYMLGNGQGKTRATATGGARTVATWRLPYISTGEVGLADHLQGAGITVRAGQEARFVDIEAAPAGGHGLFDVLHEYPNGADLSRALTTSGEQYHGAIGRAFVAHLADPAHKPAAIEYLQTSIAEFVQQCVPVDADGQVTRVAHRFGLVAAAGELAVRIGLLTWPSGEATSAARSCLESWIERRGGTAEMEREQACDLVRRHLELFGERNFRWLRTAGLSTSDFEPSTEHHGWKRQNLDGRLQYLILPSAFKTVICRGMDSASIARHLLAAGMLFPDGQGKSQQSIRVKDEGNKRLYVINPDLLGEADQPEPPAPPVQRQPPGMKDYGFKF